MDSLAAGPFLREGQKAGHTGTHDGCFHNLWIARWTCCGLGGVLHILARAGRPLSPASRDIRPVSALFPPRFQQARHAGGLNFLQVWLDRKDWLEEAREILSTVRLLDRRDAPAASLPHGDQRKLEVALLMALEPQAHGGEGYVMFAAMRGNSSTDDILAEILILADSVIQATEALAPYLTLAQV